MLERGSHEHAPAEADLRDSDLNVATAGAALGLSGSWAHRALKENGPPVWIGSTRREAHR